MKTKYKIIIGIVTLSVIIITVVFIYKNNRPNRIIQARLIDSGNLTFESIAKLYEGTLTFQNIKDGAKHQYFVCLDDLSSIKLNEIYDLPANYYIPHGGPDESMQTNGCNFLLHPSSKK